MLLLLDLLGGGGVGRLAGGLEHFQICVGVLVDGERRPGVGGLVDGVVLEDVEEGGGLGEEQEKRSKLVKGDDLVFVGVEGGHELGQGARWQVVLVVAGALESGLEVRLADGAVLVVV